MRKRFELQLEFGALPITDIKFNLKSRHELPPVLMALQHIFINEELSEKIFSLLEEKIYPKNNHTGRPGMSLWEIFVLSVVRLALDVDYDFLLDLANNHNKVRQLLGINTSSFGKQREYEYQNLHDNLMKLDDKMLSKINELIVKQGHTIKKNEGGQKENEKMPLEIKADSYVVETDVHFPTDINLMWDCARKCLDMAEKIKEQSDKLPGWRESKSLRKKAKRAYRCTSEIHRKKGKNYKNRLKYSTREYMGICQTILDKANHTITQIDTSRAEIIIYLMKLQKYSKLLEKHIDLVERRIIKEETIPHSEKMFSIFEPHTEWLNKGKVHTNVELGLNTAIVTDQYNFICHYMIMEKTTDKQVSLEIANHLISTYTTEEYHHKSISFDRGYYSALAKEDLSTKFDTVVLPKPGKKTKSEQQTEQDTGYRKIRKRHTVVESNINSLEHHGINRCPDKGIRGFKKYVALGVISYNLHQLGNILMKKAKKRLVKIKRAA